MASALQEQEKDSHIQVPSQPRGKKLILKDGSYHLVRCGPPAQPSEANPPCWQVVGDRVRFYSVERSAWEEIPAALVDWQATRQAEVEEARQIEQTRARIREAARSQLAREIDVDASVEVIPGVFLPDSPGAYVLQCLPGEPPKCAVVPMTQVNTETKLDKTRLLTQILVPIPIIPGRHKVVVAGKQAVLRLYSDQPEFFIRTADAREPELDLIRAKVKGSSREIEFISTFLTGEQMSQRKSVSVERWQIAKGVFRITLSQPLEPGEYVLAEYVPQEGLNVYVWDFGVASAAGAKAGRPK
jgi:hypothetical protein